MTAYDLTELLRKLLALPAESELVEFKEAKNSFDSDKLGQYFSALSNETNYPMASRIIADTLAAGLIKPYDPENKSKKLTRYIPSWK